MNTTTQHKTAPKTPPKTNGTSTPDQSEQTAAQAAPTSNAQAPSAPDKKPVTVMIPENLHRKVKVLAELSGVSLSDLVDEQLRAVVRERLPSLLSKLDAES